MLIRYKTWIIRKSGRRKFVASYWSPGALVKGIQELKAKDGDKIEISCVDVGEVPYQCTPGSTKATMNGRPVKKRQAKS